MKKRKSKRNKDRLSELTDPILHHIFSFLPTKQAVRASILSKRWRKFWVSIPHLSFHLNDTRARYTDTRSRNYYNRFLHERDRQRQPIERLHLHLWNFGPIRLDDCIYAAVEYNKIRELDISLDAYGRSLDIPQNVFTSSSLRVFKLINLKSSVEDLEVKLPRSMLTAAHLKTLELVNIELPQYQNQQGKVVLRCPVLENLVLVCCFFRGSSFLSIATPQLKKLVIESDIILQEDEDVYDDVIEVELDTPNLLSFVYKGGFYRSFHNLEKLSEVVGAEICAFTEDLDRDKGGYAIEVRNCLANASTLALENFEIFPPEVTNLLGEALTSFTNLKTLELRTSLIDEAEFLLTKCSSIETFVLQLTKQYISEEEKKDKLVLPKQCSLNNLKYVAVRRVRGLDIELGFLRFLLDNALALERLTITGTKES